MTTKKPRKTHTTEFKQEAVKLAAKIGVAAAARDLGVYESQIYNWRGKFKLEKSTSQREAELAAEVAKLKRQLAEQSEDLALFSVASSLRAPLKIP